LDIITSIGFGLLILVGLSVVVFLHEGGHFLAARWAGVEVEAFAIGWGKILWSWKPGRTEYRICLLPLGGYCKMKGEQDLVLAIERSDEQVIASEGSLFGAPAWKRIIISAAGPVANLITTLVVFTVLALTGVPSMGPQSRILLASDVDGRTGTAAEAAGLVSGDLVTAVATKPVRSFADLQAAIAAQGTKTQTWTIERQGAVLQKDVTPQADPASGRSLVGVYASNPPVLRSVASQSPAALAGFRPGDRVTAVDGIPIDADQVFVQKVTASKPSHEVTVDRGGQLVTLTLVPEGPKVPLGLSFQVPTYPAQGQSPDRAVATGWTQTFDMLGQMLQGLGRLFLGKENPVQALSGPIGIVEQGTNAVSTAFGFGFDFGFATLVNILAFLSLALFLMNLLPIPALDGGSIVVSLVEGIRRRRLSLKALMTYQQVGAFVVLGLLIFTTLNDFHLFGKV
jgi:regulator of sigma E protease